MINDIKRLLKGETLLDITKNNERIIIETSFYDKEHKMNSNYPCLNTCVIDSNGKDWFTATYFNWSEYIQDLKAYISYYQEEQEEIQNADSVYIKEFDFL